MEGIFVVMKELFLRTPRSASTLKEYCQATGSAGGFGSKLLTTSGHLNIGIMEKKMETTIVYWGYIGIMEKKMETTIVYWGYIFIQQCR